MKAIELTKVSKTYKKQHLGFVKRTLGLEALDLSIESGEIFGLLGLNGAGKTTTIKLILGLLRPDSGEIKILGRTPGPGVLNRIGFLPEVPYFYKYLSAREIMGFYSTLSDLKTDKARVDNILDMVGLGEKKDKRLSEFSKGMLQRIGLAQSLIHEPEILIYDEPVSGLDPLAVKEMRTMISQLKASGKTIFLSSHMISEVEKICDRVGILVKGSLVKIVTQSQWQQTEGGLESIFVSLVSESSELEQIKLK